MEDVFSYKCINTNIHTERWVVACRRSKGFVCFGYLKHAKFSNALYLNREKKSSGHKRFLSNNIWFKFSYHNVLLLSLHLNKYIIFLLLYAVVSSYKKKNIVNGRIIIFT